MERDERVHPHVLGWGLLNCARSGGGTCTGWEPLAPLGARALFLVIIFLVNLIFLDVYEPPMR